MLYKAPPFFIITLFFSFQEIGLQNYLGLYIIIITKLNIEQKQANKCISCLPCVSCLKSKPIFRFIVFLSRLKDKIHVWINSF